MFVKAFKVKSNALLAGSEKKRLRQRAQSQFSTLDETGTAVGELLGNKANVCKVKIVTHGGQMLNVYTSDKKPTFFELNERLVPTVYFLWSCPDLVHLFTTHSGVVPVLANGADLMIPGIVKDGNDLASWGRHERDEIVAVNVTSNRAAIGVGLLAHSSHDLYMCGGRGVGVKMLHVFGDKLWGMEPSVCQQVPLMGPVLAVSKNMNFPALEKEETEHRISELTEELEQIANINEDNDDLEINDEIEEPPEHEGDKKVEEPPNTDALIRAAFLNALKLHGKKIALPMLTSTFYPQYVQPELPEGVEIKKSSYKKVGQFLKQMATDGLMEIKEEKKGIEKVTALVLDHPDVITFYPYKSGKSTEQEATAVPTGTPSTPLLLTQMIKMYVVNEDTAKLFGCFNVSAGTALDTTRVRNYLRDYVSRNKILNPDTKLVALDETLKAICRADPAELLALSEVNEAVLDRMTGTYEMRSQKGPVNKGGKRAVIHLTTATRRGNKKVTLISNLEDYGINVGEFAKAVKLGAAASTTMTEVPGTKGEQLLVQGNHIRFVYELLTSTYQVPKACITGLEFAKEKKPTKKK